MNYPVELKGQWWLPSNPDTKVAGTLRYSRTEDTILELIGEFCEGDWRIDIKNPHRYDSILGISSDGKPVTLIASMPIDATLDSSCSFPVVKYITPLVIHGKHLNCPDEKFLKSISVWKRITVIIIILSTNYYNYGQLRKFVSKREDVSGNCCIFAAERL